MLSEQFSRPWVPRGGSAQSRKGFQPRHPVQSRTNSLAHRSCTHDSTLPIAQQKGDKPESVETTRAYLESVLAKSLPGCSRSTLLPVAHRQPERCIPATPLATYRRAACRLGTPIRTRRVRRPRRRGLSYGPTSVHDSRVSGPPDLVLLIADPGAGEPSRDCFVSTTSPARAAQRDPRGEVAPARARDKTPTPIQLSRALAVSSRSSTAPIGAPCATQKSRAVLRDESYVYDFAILPASPRQDQPVQFNALCSMFSPCLKSRPYVSLKPPSTTRHRATPSCSGFHNLLQNALDAQVTLPPPLLFSVDCEATNCLSVAAAAWVPREDRRAFDPT